MSRIFLSHASEDSREALALKTWLTEQEPRLANEIFLDFDDNGVSVGTRWKDALLQANSRCEAVVCLFSGHWLSSHECKVEFRTAENMGKKVFFARLEPSADVTAISHWQYCDLFGDGSVTSIQLPGDDPVEFATRGLHRLRDGIRDSGIGATSFVWPPRDQPDRAPYRGWQPFDPHDAGVFFGRDAQIVRAMDALRALRSTPTKNLFVILGPSGAGKSSFLRAGLVPRLQRDDRDFLLLDIVRPERNVLTGSTGFAKAIHAARRRLGLDQPPLFDINSACLHDPDHVRELLVSLRDAAVRRLLETEDHAAPPTVVVPLDQAEELLSLDGGDEARQFLKLISTLAVDEHGVNSGLIVAATIRTDRYEALQLNSELADLATELFGELKPMPRGQFKETILGPAERATEVGRRLVVAPDLVDQLLDDCSEGADTLPLLSLTLSKLYENFGDAEELTLAQYERMGGIRNVVQSVVDEILSRELTERGRQLKLLRDAFIPWLATIDPDNDQAMRRLARWDDLPEASRPLIDRFVDKRLLVKTEHDGRVVVEVALESLFRQWSLLASWLEQDRANIKAVSEIIRAEHEWRADGGNPAWLLSGRRLTEALNLRKHDRFRGMLHGTEEYLTASRRVENRRAEGQSELNRRFGRPGSTGVIFVNSARADSDAALALKRWLTERDPTLEFFMDLDVGSGIGAGTTWRVAARQGDRRYDTMICLISRHFEESTDCVMTLREAEQRNKKIIVARLESTSGKHDGWLNVDLSPVGLPDRDVTAVSIDGDDPVRLATGALAQIDDAVRESASPRLEHAISAAPSDPVDAADRMSGTPSPTSSRLIVALAFVVAVAACSALIVYVIEVVT